MDRPIRAHGGFTMIEVMIAAAVLSVVSSAVLYASWRISRFAHEQVEIMAADAICLDCLNVMNAIPYDCVNNSKSSQTISNQGLPVIQWKDWRGKTVKKRLLRQKDAFSAPTIDLKVSKKTRSGTEYKEMKVTVKWQNDASSGTTRNKSWSRTMIHSQANREVE